mmetsp:Transcript_10521/g.28927  ORF Transcript_10521/g.28927 Transcript_10521/m.28927 type:complete len:204 (+) Transcript_10521:314-925(+)
MSRYTQSVLYMGILTLSCWRAPQISPSCLPSSDVATRENTCELCSTSKLVTSRSLDAMHSSATPSPSIHPLAPHSRTLVQSWMAMHRYCETMFGFSQACRIKSNFPAAVARTTAWAPLAMDWTPPVYSVKWFSSSACSRACLAASFRLSTRSLLLDTAATYRERSSSFRASVSMTTSPRQVATSAAPSPCSSSLGLSSDSASS